MKTIRITKSITNYDDDSLKNYFKDINKFKLLTDKEELEYGILASKGDKQAQEKLINSNLRFVVTVAKQYLGQGLTLSDLINEGNIGLIKAAERYKPSKEVKFISYAVWWIRQTIIQAIYNSGRAIRYPSPYISKISKINKTKEILQKELDRDPSLEEIAEKCEMTLEELEQTLSYLNYCTNLENPVPNSEETLTVEDTIASKSFKDSDRSVIDSENMKQLYRCINSLKEREADVVKMSFGIGMQEMPLANIGEKFGISKERVRQIRDAALEKLKMRYGDSLKNLLYDLFSE